MSRFEEQLTTAHLLRRRRTVFSLSAVAIIAFTAASVFLAMTYLDKLDVSISPTEVESTALIEVVDGLGIVWDRSVFAVRETLKLHVSADGYKAQELEISDATWRRGKMDVVLQPLPATLVAETVPLVSDIDWYLNDTFIAQSASLKTEMSAGQYTVTARHPSFESASQVVELERGQAYPVTLMMELIKGSVKITSVPSGAVISLNRSPVGKTPLEISVDGGKHEFAVSHEDYVSRTDSVRITTETREITRHYELARQKEQVTFSLAPEGGLLTVDHVAVPAGQTASISLPVNTSHRVEYSKPGYRTDTREFTVKPNSSNQIRLSLQAVYGQLEIMSNPVADVSVNGAVVGQTPMQLRLQTVPHTIILSRDGYVSESRTITPDESVMQSVVGNLETIQSHRLNNAPDTFTNSIGMEFKLFKNPASVTMGSRRGERDTRANEFVREVRLTRPFYVGLYEVTEDQFRQAVAPGQPPLGSRRPITGISWEEAAAFCNWLSIREELNPVYRFSGHQHIGSEASADGYRMLTEAEWEWLARKAGRSQESKFPWGNDSTVPANIGNLADESAKGAVPVYITQYNDGQSGVSDTGLFQPNRVGIHDLAGNVSEWLHDSYTLEPPTGNAVETDPFDGSAFPSHVVKGPNWKSASVKELRVAFRRGSASGEQTVGLRLARYLY